MRELHCAHVLTAADAPVGRRHTIRIDGDRIAAVEAAKPRSPGALLALPALANAHDHARVDLDHGLRRGRQAAGNLDCTISRCCRRSIPISPPRCRCRAARSAAPAPSWCITPASQGLTDLPTEVAEVARAAGDVGVRVGFAVAMRDRNPLVYGPSEPVLAALSPQAREEIRQRFLRPPLPVDAQIALVDAVAAAAANPMFDVQYGPQAVQWCTHELLEAIARGLGADRPAHPHAPAGDPHPARVADANYPGGISAIPRRHRASSARG